MGNAASVTQRSGSWKLRCCRLSDQLRRANWQGRHAMFGALHDTGGLLSACQNSSCTLSHASSAAFRCMIVFTDGRRSFTHSVAKSFHVESELPTWAEQLKFICSGNGSTSDSVCSDNNLQCRAYFGLAASVALGMPSLEQTELHESSNRSSDVFSLIGTIFLWIFWPTFNGAGAPMNSQMQQRIILNTIFALTASW